MCIRGVALEFEGVRTGRKVRAPKALQTRGVSMGMLPKKSFKFTFSEMPFPAFSPGHFQ